MRELQVREEAITLVQTDAVVTIVEQLEKLNCRGTTSRPRTWLEIHPHRTKPVDSGLPGGFDALIELARI